MEKFVLTVFPGAPTEAIWALAALSKQTLVPKGNVVVAEGETGEARTHLKRHASIHFPRIFPGFPGFFIVFHGFSRFFPCFSLDLPPISPRFRRPRPWFSS